MAVSVFVDNKFTYRVATLELHSQ